MKKSFHVVWSSEGQKRVMIKCPNCRFRTVLIAYGENMLARWFSGNCQCGFKFKMRDYEFDYLQPSSPFFKMIYGDPFLEAEQNKNKLKIVEENRKLNLEKKYDKQFSKPWERKFVKDVVLKDNQGGLINA